MKKNGRVVKCFICNGSVYKRKSALMKFKKHYCSMYCQIKTYKGRRPWNKGMKGVYESNPPNAKKGQIVVDRKGREWTYLPKHPKAHRGRVLLARHLMEKHIGRFLKSIEIVHHINHDPKDNRLENLFLTDRKNHPKIHNRYNTKSPYAKDK